MKRITINRDDGRNHDGMADKKIRVGGEGGEGELMHDGKLGSSAGDEEHDALV